MKRISAVIICLSALLGSASAAFSVTVNTDPKGGPESITVAPDGSLILGSANKPVIYRARKGESQAKVFIDASSEGDVFFLGVLADDATDTLWACQLTPVPGTNSRKSVLRSFDLMSGTSKTRWTLPGDTNICNDFTIGPDHALYVTDTSNARIYRVKAGASSGELLIEDLRVLNGIDGITFLNGQLYANNVATNNIYRIPLDANGKAGDPVQIWADQPIKGPDGMRAANGKLFLAENRNGRASMLTINGDIAHVTVVHAGLTQPTAIEPAGDILWIGDRANDNAIAIPMPR